MNNILIPSPILWLLMALGFMTYVILELFNQAKKAAAKQEPWSPSIWWGFWPNRLMILASLTTAIGINLAVIDRLSLGVYVTIVGITFDLAGLISFGIGYMPSSVWNKISKTILNAIKAKKE